jgi:glutamate formiminotransferase
MNYSNTYYQRPKKSKNEAQVSNKEPEWKPDFGPQEMHKTFGVTAIGARIPLVAYNIDLNTTDVKIASSIAKTIRQSSGGFAYIQAGPVFLEERGHVQVTMNILDYKKNPMYRIFETVQMEANRYHLEITGSEVVGLLPLDALIGSVRYYCLVDEIHFSKTMAIKEIVELAVKYLKLRDFDELKVIEANL